MPLEQITRLRTADGRVVTVGKNGFHAVTIHDHPDPHAHAGFSIQIESARTLARALAEGSSATVSSLEGRVLVLRDEILGDEAAFRQRATTPQDDPFDRFVPDVVNPQVARSPRGPWSLNEQQREALSEALLAAVNR